MRTCPGEEGERKLRKGAFVYLFTYVCLPFRFLQDGKQTQLQLPDTDAVEHEKLSHLAKLYSLNMRVDRGMAVLTKTRYGDEGG